MLNGIKLFFIFDSVATRLKGRSFPRTTCFTVIVTPYVQKIIVRNITQDMTYSKTLRFLVAAILFSPICYIFVKNQHRYKGVTLGGVTLAH